MTGGKGEGVTENLPVGNKSINAIRIKTALLIV